MEGIREREREKEREIEEDPEASHHEDRVLVNYENTPPQFLLFNLAKLLFNYWLSFYLITQMPPGPPRPTLVSNCVSQSSQGNRSEKS